MAKEKFQRSKNHDNPNHPSWHANQQHLDAAEDEMAEWMPPPNNYELTQGGIDEWNRFKGVALKALTDKYKDKLGLDEAIAHSVTSVGLYEDMLKAGMIGIDGAIRSIKFFAGMDEEGSGESGGTDNPGPIPGEWT